jgi:hypothetical protein
VATQVARKNRTEEAEMARGAGRVRRAKVMIAYKDPKRLIRSVHLPPGSETARHFERKDYVVVPLTRGTMHVEIVKKVRGKERTRTKVVKLKPFKAYLRKVGRGGAHIKVRNKGRGHIHFMKD